MVAKAYKEESIIDSKEVTGIDAAVNMINSQGGAHMIGLVVSGK